jgi:hypothetical protein
MLTYKASLDGFCYGFWAGKTRDEAFGFYLESGNPKNVDFILIDEGEDPEPAVRPDPLTMQRNFMAAALAAFDIARMGGAFPRIIERIEPQFRAQAFSLDGFGRFSGWQYGEWNGWAAVLMTPAAAEALWDSNPDIGDWHDFPKVEGLVDMQGICLVRES